MPLRADGRSSYEYDPDAAPDTFFTGSSDAIWRADVTYDWRPAPAAATVSFTIAPFSADTVMAGPASADLWISATVADTDIQVTLSEVRPNGDEVYVQTGLLRASHRALDDAASSELRPVATHLEADAAPLTPGEATLVRVEILPFAHVFRAGSALRVVVGSPGGNTATWAFANLPAGGTIEVLHDLEHQSQVVVPVVPGIEAPDGAPPCGSLRGQPCRSPG
jgi:predicted acyl esterase